MTARRDDQMLAQNSIGQLIARHKPKNKPEQAKGYAVNTKNNIKGMRQW